MWGTNFHAQLAIFTTTGKRDTGIDLVPKTLRNETKCVRSQQKPLPGLTSQDASGQVLTAALLPGARTELSAVLPVISSVSRTVPGTSQGLNKDLLNK